MKRALVVASMLLSLALLPGCTAAESQVRRAEPAVYSYQLQNIQDVTVDLENPSGQFTMQPGPDTKTYKASLGFASTKQVGRTDARFLVQVHGTEHDPKAMSSVAIPVDAKPTVRIADLSVPFQVDLQGIQVADLRLENIIGPLTIKTSDRPVERIEAVSGNGPLSLSCPDSTTVKVMGNMSDAQVSTLKQLGFVNQGDHWLYARSPANTGPTITIHVAGWTGPFEMVAQG